MLYKDQCHAQTVIAKYTSELLYSICLLLQMWTQHTTALRQYSTRLIYHRYTTVHRLLVTVPTYLYSGLLPVTNSLGSFCVYCRKLDVSVTTEWRGSRKHKASVWFSLVGLDALSFFCALTLLVGWNQGHLAYIARLSPLDGDQAEEKTEGGELAVKT